MTTLNFLKNEKTLAGSFKFPARYVDVPKGKMQEQAKSEAVEWLRAPVVVEWKERHSVTWDAGSKYVGGAERAGWETLLEMETLDLEEEEWEGHKSIGGTTLLVESAKALRRFNLAWCGNGLCISTFHKECNGCSVATSLISEGSCSKIASLSTRKL